MALTTFIYALCEPGTRTVRYIGKSKHPQQRLMEHLRDSIRHNTYLGHWLNSVVIRGEIPNMVLLSEVPIDKGDEEEVRYIAAARTSLGMRLVNATAGGDGLNNPSIETREKLRAAITPERKMFIGGLNRGRHMTPLQKKTISEKNLGRKLTPEQCAAGGKARKDKKKSWASSPFIGVFKYSCCKKWVAEIRVKGKKVHLGCFAIESDAARARDVAALNFYGPNAKLNFPTITSEITETTNQSIKS